MESIEKLRMAAKGGFYGSIGSVMPNLAILLGEKPNLDYTSILERLADSIEREITELQECWAQEAREYADESAKLAELAHENAELKREIAVKHMLPVDADGEPIRVGDYLQLGNTRGEVVALMYCPANGNLPWEWQCHTGDWCNAAFAHHVKPRTLTDVLADLLDRKMSVTDAEHEISELLGGDAE